MIFGEMRWKEGYGGEPRLRTIAIQCPCDSRAISNFSNLIS